MMNFYTMNCNIIDGQDIPFKKYETVISDGEYIYSLDKTKRVPLPNGEQDKLLTVHKYLNYDGADCTFECAIVHDDYIVIIDRYGQDDYGAWWTDKEHLDDEFYGSSVRGTLTGIMQELRDEL